MAVAMTTSEELQHAEMALWGSTARVTSVASGDSGRDRRRRISGAAKRAGGGAGGMRCTAGEISGLEGQDAAAAENTGFVEVPLVQALVPQCKAAGKPEPTLQLYDNNANCIQAILAGRADTYINDVNTVDNAVKAYPDKLEKAIAVTIPYSVGIAVPKDKPKFRDAVMAALTEIYKSGDQLALLKKWGLDPDNLKEPGLLTVN
jgi:hypothetical protein